MTKQFIKLPLAALIALSSSMGMAQSSTTSTVAAPKPAKKIGVSLSNETTNTLHKASNQGGAGTTNSLSISYKVQDDLKLGIAIKNKYSIPGKGEENKNAKFGDVQLSGSVTHGGILGTEKTPVKYSVYLPTSTTSQEAKQALGLRADVTLNYEINSNLSAQIIEVPILGLRPGNDAFTNAIYSETRFANTKVISTFAYLEHVMLASLGEKSAKTDETLALGLGLGVDPNENISLTFALAQERALFESAKNNPNKDFKALDSKEVSYYFSAGLTY